MFETGGCVHEGFDARAESERWHAYRWLVVRNPLYWLCFAGTVALIVVGRCVHWLFGQHGPIAQPESSVEHEVRVWWIYPSDGAFVGGLGLVAASAVWYGARHEVGVSRGPPTPETRLLAFL